MPAHCGECSGEAGLWWVSGVSGDRNRTPGQRPASASVRQERSPRLAIGFLGLGKMATALIRAMINAGLVSVEEIVGSDPIAEQRDKARSELGIEAVADNRELLQRCGTVFVCCKPQSFSDVAKQSAECVRADHLIVSIMAGVRIETIGKAWGGKVIRVMPNTGCLVGMMAGGLSAAADVPSEDVERVVALLSSAGRVVVVPEESLDAVTGLSGSGPAFVARLIQYAIDGGVEAGLSRETARELALATFEGTARLLSRWKMPPEELVSMVSSPNGTTVAGRAVLEDSDVGAVIGRTIGRATERSRELGKPS